MKRTLTLLVALVMLLVLALPLMATAEEPIVIRWGASRTSDIPSAEDNFFINTLLEKTNVKLEYEYIGGDGSDYETVMNVRLTGGEDTPDIISCSAEYMRALADMEVLLDLTPYMETELKDIIAWCDGDITPLMYNGRLFYIPRYYFDSSTYTTMDIRNDWLKKLDLKIPTTIDELYDVAYAFTYSDPDGNNVDDTFGLGGAKRDTFEIIFNLFDFSAKNHFLIRDGKVTSTLLSAQAKDALTAAKKFVDNKVVDPDIWTANVRDQAINGKVGISSMGWSMLYKQTYVNKFKAVNPEADWTWFGALKNTDGSDGVFFPIDKTNYVGVACLSAELADQPEKLDAIFRMLDYLVTDEGMALVNFGVKGVHWDYDADGKPYMTERAPEANYINLYQLLGRMDAFYLDTKFPEAREVTAFANTIPRLYTYDQIVIAPEDFYKSDFDNYVSEQIIKFLYGERDIAEYDTFIQELYDIYNFQVYLDAAAACIGAAGYLD